MKREKIEFWYWCLAWCITGSRNGYLFIYEKKESVSASVSVMGGFIESFEREKQTRSTQITRERLQMKLAKEMKEQTGVPKTLNSELWYACAGPLVSLPQVGSLAYYFPQGHIQQVADSTRTSHIIPNYPNLPSQLLCQLQNVTLHADTETDDIYAQMSLQPLDSEKEVFPSISQFGLKPSPNNSKHPSEFFCKTLTASDTSTHGGFSVPRRAAEQLFPPLDYTVQPPTQELVVRDLHDNSWTFRHIFRGQPKRHLLTTGWSLFVGSKWLKAGDSVLFIRDKKSQLLVGIRRANSHQTSLSSSVLSADSMHIGVLAAAAHAAANRSPFTVFYNPRACPSEFVIPLVKYRKAVYETQLSIGFRFGMMFETEESGKRRYMGSIVGISDLDPLSWPGSKWRNIQVEWDEPGCSDKQNRVSSWDIETPESFFLFQSLTSSLKRPLQSGLLENEWSTFFSRRPSIQVPENGTMELSNTKPNLYSEQMIKFPFKHQLVNNTGSSLWIRQQESSAKRGPLEELNAILPTAYQKQKVQLASSVSISQKNLHFQAEPDRCYALNLHSPLKNDQREKLYPPAKMDNPLSSVTVTDKSKLECEVLSDRVFDFASIEGCNIQKVAANPVSSQCLADQLTFFNQNHNPLAVDIPQPDSAFMNTPLPQLDIDQWMYSLSCLSSSNSLRDLSAEINSQIEFDNSVNVGGSNNAGATVADPSTPSAILDEFCTLKEKNFQNSSDCLMSRDVQSQITSASLAESHVFSMQDKSGGASSSHVDFDECSFVQNNSWQQVAVQPAPRRTYTKVQKAGSVGRSLDVATLKNYEELILAIECMFGLEGLLKDTRGSGWKLVYVDYENDVLLVGDDPWELFVGCVRCIRILSPTEVQQMSEEGMKLLNSGALQGINGSMSGGST